MAAAGATDGIVVGTDNTVTCYDALQATANATIAGDKANASLRFMHVNHLLRFNVEGNTTAANIINGCADGGMLNFTDEKSYRTSHLWRYCLPHAN